jgi:hypothetical protein
MTDLSIQSVPAVPAADHTWLAGDSGAFSNAQSGTLDVSSLTSGTHYDATTKIVPAGLAVAKAGGLLVPFDAVAEVQKVTISGAPTGGTFTLTFDGQTTDAIAYNATAATVQAALEALSNVSSATVTGDAGGPWTVTFGGSGDVPQMTAASSLTGGTDPAIAVTTVTGGGSSDGQGVLEGFLPYPLALQRLDGTLPSVVTTALIVDAVIIPANLPVAGQRGIDRTTPTNGKFAFRA